MHSSGHAFFEMLERPGKLCYAFPMTNARHSSTTDITRCIARYFYVAVLDDCDATPGILQDFLIPGGDIDMGRLLDRARADEAVRETLIRYMPADLLAVSDGTLQEIDDVFAGNCKGSRKLGYVGAVLEVLYDARF